MLGGQSRNSYLTRGEVVERLGKLAAGCPTVAAPPSCARRRDTAAGTLWNGLSSRASSTKAEDQPGPLGAR